MIQFNTGKHLAYEKMGYDELCEQFDSRFNNNAAPQTSMNPIDNIFGLDLCEVDNFDFMFPEESTQLTDLRYDTIFSNCMSSTTQPHGHTANIVENIVAVSSNGGKSLHESFKTYKTQDGKFIFGIFERIIEATIDFEECGYTYKINDTELMITPNGNKLDTIRLNYDEKYASIFRVALFLFDAVVFIKSGCITKPFHSLSELENFPAFVIREYDEMIKKE